MRPTPPNNGMQRTALCFAADAGSLCEEKEITMKLADQFAKEANEQGLICAVTNRVHGWPETIRNIIAASYADQSDYC